MARKPLDIIVAMHTNNDCYKKATPVVQRGVLFHSTAANNPYLRRYVDKNAQTNGVDQIGNNKYGNHWNQSAATLGRSVCVHAFIGYDINNKIRVAQNLPYNYACWGNGGGKYGSCNGNPHARIQFEICEDSRNDKNYLLAVLDVACQYAAELCIEYGWDPHGTENGLPIILDHVTSNEYGWGGNHGDIAHWLKPHGLSMDWVRNNIKKIMDELKGVADGETDTIKIGSMVKLRDRNVKTYNGGNPASFVFNGTYRVDVLKGNRAVLDKNGICTAYRLEDLVLASDESTPIPAPSTPSVPAKIVKGSKVKIKTGAKWYGGSRIPRWAMNDIWIVLEIKGDRAIINKNASGNKSIMSPINVNNLFLV